MVGRQYILYTTMSAFFCRNYHPFRFIYLYTLCLVGVGWLVMVASAGGEKRRSCAGSLLVGSCWGENGNE